MLRIYGLLAIVLSSPANLAQAMVTIETVTVANPRNPNVRSGYGAAANYGASDRLTTNTGHATTGSTVYNIDQDCLPSVGAYGSSPSTYATFEQAGNVREWNEVLVASSHGSQGGWWDSVVACRTASTQYVDYPITEGDKIGFQVAVLHAFEFAAEPSIIMAVLLGLTGAFSWKRRRICILSLFSVLYCLSTTQASDFTTLLPFGGPTGAAGPYGDLTLSGSTLYGMTNQGGAKNLGTIFRVNTDGTGFQRLLEFDVDNGAAPTGSMALIGSTLYGMTSTGRSGWGNLFTINTDGTGFRNLLSFDQHFARPYGSLTLGGTQLYGMTSGGGVNYRGNVFSVNTDGSGLQSLFSFGGTNGSVPLGSLTLSGATLFGMTSQGGSNDLGTVFRVNTDGTGFQSLLSFDGTNGASPAYGSLTLVGSTLYGMTYTGGRENRGTVFRINTDGTEFQTLFSFDDTNGSDPLGGLTLVGSTLFGMTSGGGANHNGTIFRINADGSGFQNVLSFDSYVNGDYPMGGFTLGGSTLYGMAEGGGQNSCGVIFALTVPEPSTLFLLGIGAVPLLAKARRWSRRTG